MEHDIIFLSFWAIFWPFAPLTTRKITILKKMKKVPGDIIILHLCTTNDDHMMYGSWKYGAQQTEFFLILDHFLPFHPPNNQEHQNSEKTRGNVLLDPWQQLFNHLNKLSKNSGTPFRV